MALACARADQVTERYCRWTPEIFGTKVRGTACGIASALSRMYVFLHALGFRADFMRIVPFHRGGMIAPLLGGALLFVDRSFPVYASVVVYLVTALCIVPLHETAGQGANGERALMH